MNTSRRTAVDRRPSGRAPTIHDVARAAGVSKSSVSLAVRGQAGLSEATRSRILDAAQQLGYRSNVWARSLVQGRTGLIGVLLGDLGSSYHRDVTNGIEDAAAEQDIRLVIGHGRRDPERLRRELDSLLALGVEAVIVVSSWLPPQHLEAVAQRVPIVVVGRLPQEVPGVDTVANQDAAGARLAVEHLLSLGHRRILHLTGSSRTAAMHRRRAYSEVMRARVPEVGPQVEGPEHLDRAQAHLISQVLRGEGPTAVFTQNDRIAAELMGRCLDAGIRLPDQLSVVGYDSSSLCSVLRPRLTSIDQPRLTMGSLALRMAVERIAGKLGGAGAGSGAPVDQAPRSAALAPTLMMRESTCAPPEAADR